MEVLTRARDATSLREAKGGHLRGCTGHSHTVPNANTHATCTEHAKQHGRQEHELYAQSMLCSVPLMPFYIKIGWAMWMVVGRPPDEACGSGTGAGTLWAGALPDAPGPFVPATKKGCATAASATCQGTWLELGLGLGLGTLT